MIPDETSEVDDGLWDQEAAFSRAIGTFGFSNFYRPYLLADIYKNLISDEYRGPKVINFVQ